MSKNIIKALSDVGLDPKEAHVYIGCLEAGLAPASDIAQKAGLNRVTTYNILKKLLRRGIVSSSQRFGVQHFSALDPEVLVADVKHKADLLEQHMPLLKSFLSSPDTRPHVEFFEGLEAVKSAYLKTLQAQTEILDYANSKNIRVHWPEYDDEYVAERRKKGIFLRGLAPDDAQGRKVQEEDAKYHRETRLLPKKLFWVENEIKIFDDKFFIASFEPQTFAVFVESQAIADTQKQIFEIVWNFAQK